MRVWGDGHDNVMMPSPSPSSPIHLQHMDMDQQQWQCPHQMRTRMQGQMMMTRVWGDDDKALSLFLPPIRLQHADMNGW